jgi:hypothetical protein
VQEPDKAHAMHVAAEWRAKKGGKTEGRTEILYPDIQFSQSTASSRSTPVLFAVHRYYRY